MRGWTIDYTKKMQKTQRNRENFIRRIEERLFSSRAIRIEKHI